MLSLPRCKPPQASEDVCTATRRLNYQLEGLGVARVRLTETLVLNPITGTWVIE